MASIKVATGLKTYDVEDQYGNVRGQIRFNPSDINFINRLTQMEEKLTGYINEYDKLQDEVVAGATSDERSEAVQALAALAFYDKQTKAVINETFGDENLADVVFGGENAFNIFEGQTFIERFLEGVLPIIKADVEAATNDINKHVSKYTAQIHEK